MSIIQEPPQNCKLQNPLDEYRRNVHKHAPALGRLLDNLDAGIMPEPLEVMIAISQGVAYFTDSQEFPGVDAQLDLTAPGSRCRTC